MNATTRRLFIQNYATYSNGTLDGKWYDLEDYSDVEELEAAVKAANKEGAEEFGIFDYEGFPSGLINEYTSLAVAFAWHEAIEQADDEDAFCAFLKAFSVGYFNNAEQALEQFKDAYYGEAESVEVFAENFALETGVIDENSRMFAYIDWDHYWHGELSHDFTCERYNGTLYFFRSDF